MNRTTRCTLRAGWVAALLCLLLGGCATTTTTTPRRGDVQTALRVDVDASGRPSLFGQSYSPSGLVRRLRREGAATGRAVALHGEDGTATGTLQSLARTLVREGIPNVSVVTARRATVETADDDEATTGAGPNAAAPSAVRFRRR